MIWLLGDFDLLSVFLRALTLGLELLTLGGVAYLLIVIMPARAGESDRRRVQARDSVGSHQLCDC